jgi:RNA-binding protein NOB1
MFHLGESTAPTLSTDSALITSSNEIPADKQKCISLSRIVSSQHKRRQHKDCLTDTKASVDRERIHAARNDCTLAMPAEDAKDGLAPASVPAKKKKRQNAPSMTAPTDLYRCLVVDSGPLIRMTGLSTLKDKAHAFYTVPGVLQEIRDAKARQHLDLLPFELQTRTPSNEGVQAVVQFAKKTGDYQSLSSVDVQVLALLYDLEKEGCGDMSHVRSEPRERITKKSVDMAEEGKKGEDEVDDNDGGESDDDDSSSEGSEGDDSGTESDEDEVDGESQANTQVSASAVQPKMPFSWAAVVNPQAASSSLPIARETVVTVLGNSNAATKAASSDEINDTTPDDAGQYDDAEESDEDNDAKVDTLAETTDLTIEEELSLDFPSLQVSMLVPDIDEDGDQSVLDLEERKKLALMPHPKFKKRYDTLGKYGKRLVSTLQDTSSQTEAKNDKTEETEDLSSTVPESAPAANPMQSRIMGASYMTGQDDDVEDDGEGWITNTREIQIMKATGGLDPTKDVKSLHKNNRFSNDLGPPTSQRTACTTTDFAMQNIILQMRLELLSVDGFKVNRLKSWVLRCGACFKVYTNPEDTGPLGKRLFCDHCGSDFIQRIAASVDAKSGELRLHFSRRYKNNLRGTKYSLPKPGSGNKYKGDLLLREDQLLMGAWQVKAKMRSGGKAKSDAQSIFGKDIASNVGCHTFSMTDTDIRVGFGRRNPNAAKGRERRGKKKKTTESACGLRRY